MTKVPFAAAARAASLGLVTIAVVAGCSSTTSGSGSTGGGFGGGSAAPTGGTGGATSSGNFCHDWSTISGDLGNVASGDIGAKIAAKFDSLAAEAPAAIKADVEDVDGYVHDALSGNADPSKAQQLATSFEHIGEWIAQHC